MKDDILETMAAGMTGRFWWLVDGKPKQPHTSGHIHRDEGGYWIVEVEGWRSMENVEGSDDDAYPESMIGVLGNGTVFLSDRRRLTDFSIWSGQRIHVVRSTFETAVTGLDVNTVETDGIIQAEVLFPNQSPWGRFERPNWRWRKPDDPLGRGWSLDLPTGAATTLAIGRGLTLAVRPTCYSQQNIEQIQVNPALSLTLSSAEPKPTAELVEVFGWMQDLIGHCWGGRVLPVPGVGKVNVAHDPPGRFWSQRLAERHHTQLANLAHPFPAVHLPDLGGPGAFVRWVVLCRHHARATRAVSEGLYVGASVETRLLNTMAAIEYWVERHKDRPDWVKVWKTGPVNRIHALVRHLKPAFKGWVGDGAPFSQRIWGDYNWLKHNPDFEIDHTLARRFTWTAETMLLAELLNEVGGTAVPGTRLATHYWPLRDMVQELLKDKTRSAPPEKWNANLRSATGGTDH